MTLGRMHLRCSQQIYFRMHKYWLIHTIILMGIEHKEMKENERSKKYGEGSKIRSAPPKALKFRYTMNHKLSHLFSQSDLLLRVTIHLFGYLVEIFINMKLVNTKSNFTLSKSLAVVRGCVHSTFFLVHRSSKNLFASADKKNEVKYCAI